MFVHGLSMSADSNVALNASSSLEETFCFEGKIKSVSWLDNGKPLDFVQDNNIATIKTVPFGYGESYVVRIAEIIVE